MKTLTFTQAVRRTDEQTEFFNIGCSPTDENCAQIGDPYFYEDNLIELLVLKNQLIRTHGEPPEGAEFFIIENFHDFGTYHELNIFFIPERETETGDIEESPSQNYANKCEYLPALWDQEAKDKLRTAGHTKYQPAKVIRLKTA